MKNTDLVFGLKKYRFDFDEKYISGFILKNYRSDFNEKYKSSFIFKKYRSDFNEKYRSGFRKEWNFHYKFIFADLKS